mmetsp:Transcript_19367/g.32961  ORF Transcript_19367/g.32961 Transcript_19367/m.32961 type:complete len:149 (-) Transcript_19367:351-797(-)
MEDLMGQKQVKRIKQQLKIVKDEVREQSLNEGIISNSLFMYKYKLSSTEKGRNHLYDSIEEEIEPAEGRADAGRSSASKTPMKEFTEEDLINNEEVPSSCVVRSSPHKLATSLVNPNNSSNPYVNSNLDSDLSATIGKKKGSRKQINT